MQQLRPVVATSRLSPVAGPPDLRRRRALLQRFSPTDLLVVSAAEGLASVVVCRLGLGDHPAGAERGGVVRRTRAVNRVLLGSPVLRPAYVSL